MKGLLPSSVWVLLGCLTALPGCSRSQLPTSEVAGSAATAPSRAATSTSLELSYENPAVVGTRVHATATGRPAGKTVRLPWGPVNGRRGIEDADAFPGKT